MKRLILIFGLILGSAGFMVCQPETAFGQDDKTSVKSKPPTIIKYTKQAKTKRTANRWNSANPNNNANGKRKRPRLRRKVDLSKVPYLIRPPK